MESKYENLLPRKNKEEFGSLNLKLDHFCITIVNIMGNNSIAFDVTEDTIVTDVKKKITEVTGVRPENQQLVFNGRKMDEEELLFYTLVEGDRVVLVVLGADVGDLSSLLVFFEDGTETAIEVREDTSMLVIKQKISLMIGVKTSDMVLTKKGKQLEDTEVVGFYGMEGWDMLKLRVYRTTKDG